MIDIFSDDGTHSVFLSLNLGAVLLEVLVHGNKLLQNQLMDEDLERLNEVLANLEAFLDYKDSQ